MSDFINIEDYCYLEGCVYRLLPVKADQKRGGILTESTFDLLMNKFRYGNINNPAVYCDKESYGMALYMRNNYARLAQAMLLEGKKEKAIQALDRGLLEFPDFAVPYDVYMVGYAELYFMAGQPEKALAIFDILADIYDQNMEYYLSVKPKYQKFFDEDIQQALAVLDALSQYSAKYGKEAESRKYGEILGKYYQAPPSNMPSN